MALATYPQVTCLDCGDQLAATTLTAHQCHDPLTSIYLNAGDVAELLHCSPKAIGRWVREGKLHTDANTRGGGHRRYQARAILDLRAETETTAPPITDQEFVVWYVRRHPTRRIGG